MLRRMGRQYTIEHRSPARIGRGGPRDRAVHRRDRRLQGRLRHTRPRCGSRPSATTRSSWRPTVSVLERRRLARGRRRREAPAAGGPARIQRRSGSIATVRGSGDDRGGRHGGAAQAPHHEDDEAEGTAIAGRVAASDGVAHLTGRSREQLVHGRIADPSGALVRSASTTRVHTRRGTRLTLAPLVVIGGPTATGKTASRSSRAADGDGRPAEIVSNTPSRCTGWTSARQRMPAERPPVRPAADPDEPFSAWPRSATMRSAPSRHRRSRRGHPRGRHRVLLRAVMAGLDTDVA
jgi:hypothetical protein